MEARTQLRGDTNNNSAGSPCGASMAETVVTSSTGGTGGTGGTDGTGGGTNGSGTAHFGGASVSGTTVIVPVSCSSSGPCAVTLALSATEMIGHTRLAAFAARSRRIIIARASVHIAAGGHARVRLRLNAKGRALLKHHSPLHALLRLSAGGKTVATQHITIRRPRH